MSVLYCLHGVIMYTWPLKELWLLGVGLVVVCRSQSHSRRNLSSLLYGIEAVLGN